ncbi:transcription factor MYB48-like isoform X1 [Cucurbita maxima]|uniref:Transcription factor MYB48-like isoform X1 n=1 Tax=Cucurbita maxima TaxID=3661 RepID=A0A6J1KDA1_CUCMA|nr:transcription factor MYB48-like isoform X1 [Cucurbita maxima]
MVQEESIRKGPWTEQEDFQLVCFVGLFGDRRWDFIAKVSGLKRNGKSCRLRWVNYLHPGLKRGKMSPQEERLVLDLHSKWGNRWSKIARKLPGRTDNEIKNFWRTHVRKLAQEKKKAAVHHVVVSPSSSSTVDSVPTIDIGEESFYDTGGDWSCYMGEEDEKGYSYSMDDIWRDIDDQSVVKAVCDEKLSCGPVASPAPWEYGEYSPPWKVAEENFRI